MTQGLNGKVEAIAGALLGRLLAGGNIDASLNAKAM